MTDQRTHHATDILKSDCFQKHQYLRISEWRSFGSLLKPFMNPTTVQKYCNLSVMESGNDYSEVQLFYLHINGQPKPNGALLIFVHHPPPPAWHHHCQEHWSPLAAVLVLQLAKTKFSQVPRMTHWDVWEPRKRFLHISKDCDEHGLNLCTLDGMEI